MIRNICITDADTMTLTQRQEVIDLCECTTIEDVITPTVPIEEKQEYYTFLYDDGDDADFMHTWSAQTPPRSCIHMTYSEFVEAYMPHKLEPIVLFTLGE